MTENPSAPHLVCTSHAFLGGRLSLAHAAAVYLPASVDAKLGALFGRPGLLATGIDVHGRQGERVLEDAPLNERPARLNALIEQFPKDLAQLGIEVDIYVRTDAPDIAQACEIAIERLHDAGLLVDVQSATFRCKGGCGDLSVSETRSGSGDAARWKAHARAVEEDDLMCALCGAGVETSLERQVAIDLSERKDIVAEMPDRCVGKSARKLAAATLKGDFNEWVISRTHYNGLPFPGRPERQLYLWFPAIVSKAALAEYVGLNPEEFFRHQRAKFYFSKNILQYYALVLPLILSRCFGVDRLNFTYHIRGFCDLSRSVDLLDVGNAITAHGLAAVRFFCLYTVNDDARDFQLSTDRLHAVEKGVLTGVFAAFLGTVENMPASGPVVRDTLPPRAADLWDRLDRMHFEGKIRGILLALETAIQAQMSKPLDDEAYALAHITRQVLDIYIPGWEPRAAPE